MQSPVKKMKNNTGKGEIKTGQSKNTLYIDSAIATCISQNHMLSSQEIASY